MPESHELPGLRVHLDKVVYHQDSEQLPDDTPHAFIYFLTITNLSNTTVQLLGRRWILREADGHQKVIEGAGIVGKEPTLAPGESFSYNSYHITHCDCVATGSFHGIDSDERTIHCRIPVIEMKIPDLPESDTQN